MTRRARGLRRVVVAALAGAVFALSAPLAAAAHDALVVSDPAADTTVAALPATITLTFTADILAEPGAAQLQATDAAGVQLVAGDPVVSGTTVTTPLAGEVEGSVRVLWRVVSSDGHPISGEFAFTVASAPTATTTPTASETPAPTTDTATPGTTAEPVADGDDRAGGPSFAIVGAIAGVVAVGGLGALVAVLVARARRGGTAGPGDH